MEKSSTALLSLSSVNMSLSAPSSRSSFSFSIFIIILDLNIIFKIPFCFLWHFSQFHFSFKLTGNFLRCLYYFSVILPYVPLLPSFDMFSCSLASSLGSCTDLFRCPNISFFISTICDWMVQSPFLTVSLSFCDIFTLLLYELLTILSLGFLKCGFLTSSNFQFCVLLLFLACSHCRIK